MPMNEVIAVSGTVREISEQQFDAEVLKASGTVVVDFWAPWCGPCRMVGPEVEKLATRARPDVSFVKVNVDQAQGVARRYGVMSIPTIAKFENGALVSQVVGARTADALGREFGVL